MSHQSGRAISSSLPTRAAITAPQAACPKILDGSRDCGTKRRYRQANWYERRTQHAGWRPHNAGDQRCALL